MAIRKYKPTTPGRRGASGPDFAEVTRGELYLKSTAAPVLGVAAIIGLAGDVEGRVLLDMSRKTAVEIA